MNANGGNVILQREELSRAKLRKYRPVAEGNKVPVYVDGRGRMFVGDRPLTAAEIWFDPPRVVYMVDTAVHTASLQLSLPSKEEAFSFTAAVSVAWQVVKPKDVVETGLTNAEEVYRPYLLEQMRKESRLFDVESSGDAEKAINSLYAGSPIGLPQGLVLLRCSLSLTLDADAERHIAARTAAQRATELRTREHSIKLADAERATRESEAAHRVARQQLEHKQELEAAQQHHEIEMQELRMEVYAQALREGSVGLIKLRLERNPDDVDGVIQLISRERELSFEAARKFLETAIAGGMVSPKNIAGAVAQAADSLGHLLRHPNSGFGEVGALPGGTDSVAPGNSADEQGTQHTDPSVTEAEAVIDADPVPRNRTAEVDDDDCPV